MYVVKLYIFVRISEKKFSFNFLVLEAKQVIVILNQLSKTLATHLLIRYDFRFETYLLARVRKDSRKFTSDRSKGRGLR